MEESLRDAAKRGNEAALLELLEAKVVNIEGKDKASAWVGWVGSVGRRRVTFVSWMIGSVHAACVE